MVLEPAFINIASWEEKSRGTVVAVSWLFHVYLPRQKSLNMRSRRWVVRVWPVSWPRVVRASVSSMATRSSCWVQALAAFCREVMVVRRVCSCRRLVMMGVLSEVRSCIWKRLCIWVVKVWEPSPVFSDSET